MKAKQELTQKVNNLDDIIRDKVIDHLDSMNKNGLIISFSNSNNVVFLIKDFGIIEQINHKSDTIK